MTAAARAVWHLGEVDTVMPRRLVIEVEVCVQRVSQTRNYASSTVDPLLIFSSQLKYISVIFQLAPFCRETLSAFLLKCMLKWIAAWFAFCTERPFEGHAISSEQTQQPFSFARIQVPWPCLRRATFSFQRRPLTLFVTWMSTKNYFSGP